jgi:hypothetical protein
MKKILFGLTLLAWSLSSAQQKISSEKLLTDQKGFFTCAGAGSTAPLFNRECVKLNVARIAGSGSIKYECTCVDSNTTTFFMACDAFTLEYSPLTTPPVQKGLFND